MDEPTCHACEAVATHTLRVYTSEFSTRPSLTFDYCGEHIKNAEFLWGRNHPVSARNKKVEAQIALAMQGIKDGGTR